MEIIMLRGMINIPALTLMYTLVHQTRLRWNIRLLQDFKDLKKRENKCHHISRA